MKELASGKERFGRGIVHATLFVLALIVLSSLATPTFAQYKRTDLVSNQGGTADRDPNLVNAWGITRFPFTPFWVSDNGTGVSTLYDGTGQPQPTPTPLVVTIPSEAGGAGHRLGARTGMAEERTVSPASSVRRDPAQRRGFGSDQGRPLVAADHQDRIGRGREPDFHLLLPGLRLGALAADRVEPLGILQVEGAPREAAVAALPRADAGIKRDGLAVRAPPGRRIVFGAAAC